MPVPPGINPNLKRGLTGFIEHPHPHGISYNSVHDHMSHLPEGIYNRLWNTRFNAQGASLFEKRNLRSINRLLHIHFKFNQV